MSQETSRKGQRQSQLTQTLPTGVHDLQIGAFSSGIKFVKTSINLEIVKIEADLTEITFYINDLKKNNRHSVECHSSTMVRIDLISTTCDRVESKYQVQDDEIGALFTKAIDDQLKILKNHVLTVVNNTNQSAIHLARSDSERKKLKDEILAHVENIHKNYETNPHIPRHYKPLTEEKLSVKGSLTYFLGENAIYVKDIPKLEEWPKFFGEGKYNHIEVIRAIDMLQEDFHTIDQIIVGKLPSLFTRTAKKWY
ncbi:hypothetical protein O181_034124 [Austropuccinia psidii MF-1]|uniref:Uncharacterized protein n=1 Tax=Austropuccinia psidii MF-1 TaxID=1389203 RepID=A0A9Q3H975_9BASI|nr:hypothetical protein [Austropuccinia psidii MF-1]